MIITVRLYGSLRRFRPQEAAAPFPQPFTVDLPVGTSVAGLGLHLGIPEGVASAAAVNNVAVEIDTVMQDGDRVSLFPPAAGG